MSVDDLALAGMLELVKRYPRFRVFPVKEGTKDQPLIKDWPNRASGDRKEVLAWAKKFPRCNWGLATGKGSGVFVIDTDSAEAREKLLSVAPELRETLQVRTPRGFHFYLLCPDGPEIRCSAGKLGTGIDVRGEGGYVLLPGSSHPSGGRYEC